MRGKQRDRHREGQGALLVLGCRGEGWVRGGGEWKGRLQSEGVPVAGGQTLPHPADSEALRGL